MSVKRIHEPVAGTLLLMALAGCNCHSGSGAPVLPVPPPSVEPLPGIERIQLQGLVIGPPASAKSRGTEDVFEYRAALPIPGSTSAAVAVVEHRPQSRSLPVQGIRCESMSGDSYEVARDVEGKRLLMTAALGRARIAGSEVVRAVTVLIHDKFDGESLYYMIAPWPMTEGITLQSRLLAKKSTVERTRDFSAVSSIDVGLFAVGDCDGDRDDDFLLLMRNENESLLVSGASLKPIGTIAVPGLVGRAACELPDLDGDGIREIFTMMGGSPTHSPPRAQEIATSNDINAFCVISPKKNTVHTGKIDAFGDSTAYVRAAGNAGRSVLGDVQVALVYMDRDRVSRIFVVDVSTGRALEPIEVRSGWVPKNWELACGRIVGGEGRRWLAWSETARDYSPPRLFVAEIGVADSTVEVALPSDGRAYGESGCTVPIAGTASDGLAITVAARLPGSERIEFDPVLFLDLSRCFSRH